MNKFLIQEYIFYCWGTWLTPLACRASLDLWTWGKEEKERKKVETCTCHALQWPSLACFIACHMQREAMQYEEDIYVCLSTKLISSSLFIMMHRFSGIDVLLSNTSQKLTGLR